MPEFLEAGSLDREGLATGLANVSRANLRSLLPCELSVIQIPKRGGVLVCWNRNRADPFPDLLFVRDEELSDVLAWVSSYFPSLAPITQWCRILPRSEAIRLIRRERPPSLPRGLGIWVGAILAECSAQSLQQMNLSELPGTAALTSATFAAARAVAVWGEDADLKQISARHEELTARLREGPRPISPQSLLSLWQTVAGLPSDAEANALKIFSDFIQDVTKLGADHDDVVAPDLVTDILSALADRLNLPELVDCGRGPQLDRLHALDALAHRLEARMKSSVLDASLGLAASLVDPGAAVLPDLLRKHSGMIPLASIWLGAFAGVWSPSRVLSDHQGLGRIIAKSLLAQGDLESKPSCDIAYDELSRWLGAPGSKRPVIRGMAARSLSVELALGVTCPFAVGRVDISRVEQAQALSDSRSELAESELSTSKSSGSARNQPNVIEALERRVGRLEQTTARLAESLVL